MGLCQRWLFSRFRLAFCSFLDQCASLAAPIVDQCGQRFSVGRRNPRAAEHALVPKIEPPKRSVPSLEPIDHLRRRAKRIYPAPRLFRCESGQVLVRSDRVVPEAEFDRQSPQRFAAADLDVIERPEAVPFARARIGRGRACNSPYSAIDERVLSRAARNSRLSPRVFLRTRRARQRCPLRLPGGR
jgi:hypothetical protein